MVEFKNSTPHVYSNIDCNIDGLVALCDKFDHPVSTNDFVIKAAAQALHVVPNVNASWSDDGPVQHKGINIGIAFGSPNGVITPVINDADQMDVSSISYTVMVGISL